MYKIVKFLPYFLLIILSLTFIVIATKINNSLNKAIFINLASSSIFLIIAYFAYERIKSFIDKHEAEYIELYIKRQIANDIFAVLYLLKKYISGYGLETNTIENIFSINEYSKKRIYGLILKQQYLGFQIFREMVEIKDLFRDAIGDNLIIKYSPREYIISILRIIRYIEEIECIFRDERNFTRHKEEDEDFIFVDGKELNPKNEESRFILLKKTKIENRFVVYDSGKFEQSNESKLLCKYNMKKEAAGLVASKICNLNQIMKK
ncbi:hypothetical protein ES703_06328 [subsurface metagenome]